MKKTLSLSFITGFALAALSFCLWQGILLAQETPGATDDRALGHPSGKHHPPTTLKKVGDHWTPYDPPDPESFATGSRIHIIVKGDTLWDLAGVYLENPYLWPQIWDENRYITESHWIYPGDPLMIPGTPTVISENVDPAIIEMPSEDGAAGDPSETAPASAPTNPMPTRPAMLTTAETMSAQLSDWPELTPVAGQSDVECATYIVEVYEKPELRISGREDGSRTIMGPGDIVFLNEGMGGHLTPGDEFTVIEYGRVVPHPIFAENVGESVRMIGRVRIIALQENSATAEIVQACDAVTMGMRLVPYEEKAIPMAAPSDLRRYGNHFDPSNAGYIVDVQPLREIISDGDIVNVDLGADNGLEPGDVLTVFREWAEPAQFDSTDSYIDGVQARAEMNRVEGLDPDGFPQTMLGQVVILMTQSRTATGMVINSAREIALGDRVASE